jgi:hypothetical protein
VNTSTAVSLGLLGSFNNQALAAGRDFDARDFTTDESILGLTREAGYVWGTFRDDEGGLYTSMRRIAGAPLQASDDGWQSLGGKLIVQSTGTDRGEQMQLRKEARHAADSGIISVESSSREAAIFASAADGEGNPFRLKLSQDDFSYSEATVINVTGTLAAPPLQWYLPGRESSLLYHTQTWLAEGELLGKPVRGFMFWEEAWMYPGARLYRTQDPLHDAEYLTWYSWANHWPDGTSEVGHFLFGQEDFHVGIIGHSDGTVTSAKSMNAVVTRGADGYWHDGINYTIDGTDWVCEPDPNGQMRGLGNMPNPQQEGRMHRVDDTRTPDVWMAWGESVPSAGVSRRS